MSEQKLQEKFEQYKELAKTNKDIDVAGLMIKDLEEFQSNYTPINKKRWAFALSLMVPLIGFYFSVKHFSAKSEDSQEIGLFCGILACVNLIVYYFIFSSITSGVTTQQLLELRPSDVIDLIQ